MVGLYNAAAPAWSGHRDQRFLYLCRRIIADLIEIEMRKFDIRRRAVIRQD